MVALVSVEPVQVVFGLVDLREKFLNVDIFPADGSPLPDGRRHHL